MSNTTHHVKQTNGHTSFRLRLELTAIQITTGYPESNIAQVPLGRRRQGPGRASPLKQTGCQAKIGGVQPLFSHVWKGPNISEPHVVAARRGAGSRRHGRTTSSLPLRLGKSVQASDVPDHAECGHFTATGQEALPSCPWGWLR